MIPFKGYNRKRKRPLLRVSRISSTSSADVKSVGSALANPGSEPKIAEPAKVDPPTISGVTEPPPPSTSSSESQNYKKEKVSKKYKYKYKYPSSKHNSEGVDPYHMQQKALPGEQYRGGAAMRQPPYKKARIEQISVPGDQYKIGSGINMKPANDWEDQFNEDEKGLEGSTKKPIKPTIDPESYSGRLQQLGEFIESASHNLQMMGAPEYYTGKLNFWATKVKNIDTYIQSMNTFYQNGQIPSVATLNFQKEKLDNLITQDMLNSESLGEGDKGFLEGLKDSLSNIKNWYTVEQPNINKGLFNPYFSKGGHLGTGEPIAPPNTEASKVKTDSAMSDNEIKKMEKTVVSQEGIEPSQAYQDDGNEKAQSGGDPNRLDPITPATGSRQTSATANSIVSVKQLKQAAENTVARYGPKAVHGNARERANMGKGALDTYEFQGPYDYPIYPGGRPDDSLTLMGAWRTNGGNDSSLWYSRKTSKGADSKRNKYWKYSMKNGGGWRKMTKDEMVNVFQKGGQNDNRFYGTRTGIKFKDFVGKTLRHKDNNALLGKIGNIKSNQAQYGYSKPGHDKYKTQLTRPQSFSDVPQLNRNIKPNGGGPGIKEGTGNDDIGHPSFHGIPSISDEYGGPGWNDYFNEGLNRVQEIGENFVTGSAPYVAAATTLLGQQLGMIGHQGENRNALGYDGGGI